MPAAVTAAAVLQLLLAATMIVIPVLVAATGRRAQQAAEAEVSRQGHNPDVLARHGIRFNEAVWEFAFAMGIAAGLAVMAALTLTGTARPVVLIAEALVLLVVGFITASQVFAVRYTRAALDKSADPQARAIDATAVIAAASAGYSRWVRPLVLVRFPLATVGAVAAIVLLLTPAATAYFG
ncbi:hypothetical protein [Nocardia sp. NPDC127526]|uniref:hypothetical protein n=1 Tax=Nocardia sp. NPDC127526 TaxID=3345393 RepID=UPI00362DA4B5